MAFTSKIFMPTTFAHVDICGIQPQSRQKK